MNSNEIKLGMIVWLPCEVRGGPFPDERRVFVPSELGDWFGFVNVSELKNKAKEGPDQVKAFVLAVESDRVVVGINGQSPASKTLSTQPSFIQEYGAL